MGLLAVAILLYISVEIRVYRERKTNFNVNNTKDIELTIGSPCNKNDVADSTKTGANTNISTSKPENCESTSTHTDSLGTLSEFKNSNIRETNSFSSMSSSNSNTSLVQVYAITK